MKKLFLASVAVACLASPSMAQAQSNYNENSNSLSPYIGVYGGYGWADVDNNAGVSPSVDGVDYGVYVGIQADSLLDSTVNQTGLGLTGAIEAHYGGSSADDNVGGVNIEKNDEWGINFRPGIKFLNNDAVVDVKPYGIIGYRQTNFEASAGGITADDYYNGFELGLGTELVTYDNVGVRFDYTHVWYGEKNGIDPDEDNLRVGLGYKF